MMWCKCDSVEFLLPVKGRHFSCWVYAPSMLLWSTEATESELEINKGTTLFSS